jgi:hypothetical protein
MNLYPASTPPMNFYIDNRGAEDLIRSEFNTKRSKHLDIRYHYVRDRDIAEQGIINIVGIGTKDMAADGFTKPLAEHLLFLRCNFLKLYDKSKMSPSSHR